MTITRKITTLASTIFFLLDFTAQSQDTLFLSVLDQKSLCPIELNSFQTTNCGEDSVGQVVNGPFVGDQFGYSCALSSDGNTMVVAGNDFVQVQQRQADCTWMLLGQEILFPDPAPLWREVAVDVSADGETIIVTNPRETSENGQVGAGAVRVFDLMNSTWIQRGQTIYGSDDYEFFGTDVKLSADGLTWLASAPWYGSESVFLGQVRRYDWNGESWIVASSSIEGSGAIEELVHVEMSNDASRVVSGGRTGVVAALLTHDWNGDSWVSSSQPLIIPDLVYVDVSGLSISLSGNGTRLVVSTTVATYTYDWSGETGWNLINTWDDRATAVELDFDGNHLSHGFKFHSGGVGVLKLLNWSSNEWGLLQEFCGLNPGDRFGQSAAVSEDGTTFMAGTNGFGSSVETPMVGYVKIYGPCELNTTGLLEYEHPMHFDDTSMSPFPNPFNETINLAFNLSLRSDIGIMIYNIQGSAVDEVEVGTLLPGKHQFTLNTSALTPGLYMLKVEIDGEFPPRHKAWMIRKL
jgi:hypothetical protein